MEIRIFVLTALLLACGGGQSQGTTPEGDALSLDRLYPLATGNAWAYDVTDGDGENGLLTVTVTELSEGRAELLMAGTDVTYERRPDGIFDVRNNVYVLRGPVQEGTRWDARSGRQARIVSIDASVETPAGTFEGCVHVAEEGGDGSTSVASYFCPDIGVARVRIEVRTSLSGRTVINDARLRTLPLLNEHVPSSGGRRP